MRKTFRPFPGRVAERRFGDGISVLAFIVSEGMGRRKMSSFKRKAIGKQALPVYPGTRISPASNQCLITSTGISSLDDILGGGLPLSCSLVFAAPDIHSSYGDLVQKYFFAQGLANGHRICLVGKDPEGFVKDVMWYPKSHSATPSAGDSEDEEKDEEKGDESQKVKIAWRYENMKQFKTTVGNSSSEAESYCQTFELASRVPEDVINKARKADRLRFVDVGLDALSPSAVLSEITRYMESDSSAPVRICITSLGSPVWGDLTSQNIVYFLHSLRATLRKHPHACASTSLAPEVSAASWGGAGWIDKVGWVSDGALTLSAFTANPALSSMFPAQHGLLQIHTLPSPHTLSAPSDRLSTLRGLSSSGENNLAFKCTRKRLIFETLHLDVEGGTSERRTRPSGLMVDGGGAPEAGEKVAQVEGGVGVRAKKGKKRVAFDYDF
ncbi:unnamed protein product [Cyclocybe aegerita]|uniref:Elongator complex protein 4 n=1 Tax=Cyclocybe aegerita TaxID=1973307 RepID=A0A8S0W8B7_CYCAE|nr:unnamed protein product [Cyclocybe aegerita]